MPWVTYLIWLNWFDWVLRQKSTEMSTYIVNSLLSPHLNPLRGRVLLMMAYLGRFAWKGVPGYLFQASSCIRKGRDFTSWSISNGREVAQRAKRCRFLWLYKVEKTFYFCDWFLFKRQCIYSSWGIESSKQGIRKGHLFCEKKYTKG